MMLQTLIRDIIYALIKQGLSTKLVSACIGPGAKSISYCRLLSILYSEVNFQSGKSLSIVYNTYRLPPLIYKRPVRVVIRHDESVESVRCGDSATVVVPSFMSSHGQLPCCDLQLPALTSSHRARQGRVQSAAAGHKSGHGAR